MIDYIKARWELDMQFLSDNWVLLLVALFIIAFIPLYIYILDVICGMISDRD